MTPPTYPHELRTIEILLVDDDPADVELTTGALKDGKLLNRVNVVNDGVEALTYLRKQGKYSDAMRPDVVLLDLNMPRKDGRAVLEEMKADPVLQDIPVVVLTTSDADSDIVRSYKLQAICYVTKPVNIGEFHKVVQSISEFWFSVVKLPPQTRH
jgi:two-component system, chemotaxis family, response regulator Rcp1